MADFYVWNAKDLGLNVEDMDKEHQELIRKMNFLYSCVENKGSTQQILKAIEDLANFTVKHFADEEAYMERVNFPGITTHKLIHKQLLTQFGEHVDHFKKTSALKPTFLTF